MKKQIVCLSVMMVGMLSSVVFAQREIVIEGTGTGVSVLDFTRFEAGDAAGREFLDALRKNLQISGHFRSGTPGEAAFRVLGSARVSGGELDVQVRVTDRGGDRARYQQRYRVDGERARAMGRRVSDEIVKGMRNEEGFANKRIIFVGTRPGVESKELYAVYPDGEGLVQLTRFNSVVLGPRWAPDGGSIVYTSYHRGFPDVIRQQLRTGELEVLASQSGLNAGGAISPDGRHAALILSRDGKPELYVMNLRTRRLTRLTDTPMSGKSSPAWSPDGEQIVFVSDHQGVAHLYVIRREGGAPRRVTRGGGQHVSPVWGKNGLIAYTQRSGGRNRVVVLNPRTGEGTTVSPNDADYEDPSWGLSGRHLVVTRTLNRQSQIYLLDTRGGATIAVTNQRGNWYMPTWSP